MKINSKTLLTLLLFALLTSGFIMNTAHAQIKATKMKQRPQSMEKQIKISYPQTRQDNSVSDNYHGTTVKDPYRWLEEFCNESPVMHIKQVMKNNFSHLPFTKKNNKNGIIKPKKILDILAKNNIFDTELSFELSFKERDPIDKDLKKNVLETVNYWKEFIN